ncbi:MAG: glycosyltransferase family 4 protein [Candidatus Pacearchaeota archaeon]
MKSTKVYLQYPWKFPDSPYYKYLIDNPPKRIKYLNIETQTGVITNKWKFLFSNSLKRTIRDTLNFLNLHIVNAHKSPEGDYDLIHCAHCLSKNSNKPWILDVEGVWQFYIGKKTKSSKKKVRGILLEKNCKKILPWTESTAKEIIKEFPEIKDKVEVIYPAVPLPKIKKVKRKEINLLFVGRYFYAKGGFHALEVMDKLTKKHSNVKGIIVSEVPEEIKKNYSENKKIKFFGLMPQKDLMELYLNSDILIYPGYSDSFGFAYLEAMSFGIPIMTVDGFARKEIIKEGKTGFVFGRPSEINPNKIGHNEQKLISQILTKTEQLIKNKNLREKISQNGIEEIKNGKFSIKERNKKLKRIYLEILG